MAGREDEKKEFIAERIEALKESVRLFSPHAKEERETWVVKEFLSYIRPGTPDSAIKWVDAEPWDALCLAAKFQIKEIQDPGRRRHAEFKEALERARRATEPAELFEDYSPTRITAAQAVDIVLQCLGDFSFKYAPDVSKELDLLVYLNIESSISTNDLPAIDDAQFDSWRSVSVLCNDCAFVLWASPRSPQYISSRVGAVRRR